MHSNSAQKTPTPEHTLLFQAKCSRFNEFFPKSTVEMAVTTEKVQVVKGSKVSWESGRADIQAVTMSTLSQEFVLHLKDQPDMRLTSESRGLLMQALLSGESVLCVYMVHQKSLEKYVTTKKDIKKEVSRMPKEAMQKIDLLSWQHHLNNLEKGHQGTFQLLYQAGSECPQTIREFQVQMVIGRGSVSTIYLVTWQNRNYALKSIPKTQLHSCHGPEQAQQVISKLKTFQQQKYLAHLEFCYESEKRVYFITKFYQRGDLFSHLQEVRKLEKEKAQALFCQVALALDCLHQQGLVYADLKPENILLDDYEQDSLVLTDFGLGRLLREDHKDGQVVATPEYMPPELFQGQGYSQASDYYQLGLLLYEMLFGILPYYHEDPAIMTALIQQFPLVFPKEMHEASHSLIKALLSREPKERPQSLLDLQKYTWIPSQVWQQETDRVYKPSPESSWPAQLDQFDRDITCLPTIDFCYE